MLPQSVLDEIEAPYCGAEVSGGIEGGFMTLEPGPAGVGLLGLPTGLDVLLAGWPMVPVLPPLTVGISESGS
jgi:hypothetical protein